MGPDVGRRPRAATVIGAMVADIVSVLAFVAIGRATHAENVWNDLGSTALPFLVGLAVGWLLVRAWRRPLSPVLAGVPIWLATAVVAILLRLVFTGGTEVAFIIVAAAVLLTALVGWRAVVALTVRARTS